MKLNCILFLAITLNSFSQEKIIKGVIKDVESKSFLQYVTIGISNKSIGTVSSFDGKFSLKLNESINENDLVTFSYVGYQTKIV
jgi:hypothetical protein